MLTCKDWMIYILEHGLINEPIFNKGKLLGFISVMEAAVNFDVGEAPVRLWVQMNMLDSVKIGNVIYIPAWVEDPRKKGVE